jgi:trans-aconitate methyltransferase
MEAKPQLGQTFSAYMDAFAQDLDTELLAHIPISPEHLRLLDLGGSHGMHSIRFCQRYPQLSALIVDLPSALTETAGTIASHQLSERIHVSPGELLVHDWDGKHDVVFYLSVAHNHFAEENRQAIQQIFDALNPGGLLVIHEYLADTANNAFMAAFRLTLLYETGTQTYRYGDYVGWLEAAGFAAITRINLNPLEKGTLILATRPG